MNKKIIFSDVKSQYRKSKSPQIEDITFTINQGEFILLAGPSGSGKSTLVLLLNGIIPHHTKARVSGIIEVFDNKPLEKSVLEMSKFVGMLLQDPESQLATTKVIDELVFTLEFQGKNPEEIKNQIDYILDRFELQDLKDHDTTRMSGGEKQLVALAAMMTLDPELIILDEPTSNLDPINTTKVLKHVKTFKDEGKTIILIEHKINEVFNICPPDKIMLMHQGKIKSFGNPIDLFKTSNFEFTGLKIPEIAHYLKKFKFPEFKNQFYPFTFNDFKKYLFSLNSSDVESLKILLAQKERKNHITGMKLLQFIDADFFYRNHLKEALSKINLKINDGELVAIIGNNGAGKSTLVKHIIGLNKPKSGRLLINEIDTQDQTSAELARKVSFLFQNPDNQIFSSTVLKEVKYGPINCGVKKVDAEVYAREAIDSVNLREFIDQNPIKLSMGQKQRVAVASALAMKPKIIVLDEPTTGQDPTSLKGIVNLMLTEYQKGVTILLVTHDMNLVDEIANRIIVLKDGKVIKDGKTDDIFTDYVLLEECNLEPPIRIQMLRIIEKILKN